DGKIVAVGASGHGNGDFAVVRYDTDGSLDPGFGNGGIAFADIGVFDEPGAVALQPDGKIVVAGATSPQGHCCVFSLARSDTGGGLDPTFGTGGTVSSGSVGLAGVASVLVQGDGKIVLVGSSYQPTVFQGIVIARYDANGALDPTFGNGGIVKTTFGG